MPSPLAHAAAGYALYRILRVSGAAEPRLLRATIAFSLLPDVDSLVGLAGRNFYRYHNNITHSFGFVMVAGILTGTLFGWRKGRFWRWFSAGSLAYSFHLGLDYWATRRGLLLLWPFSSRRFISPVKLFYGFQWGRGIWSITHVWTLLTELLFSLALITGTRWLTKRMKV